MDNHEGRVGIDNIAGLETGIGGGALEEHAVEFDAVFTWPLLFIGEGVSAKVERRSISAGVLRKLKFNCISLLSLLCNMVFRSGVC